MMERRGQEEHPGRRRFLYELGILGVGGIFSLLLAIPLVGYFFSVLFKRSPEQWVRVCSLDQINTVTPTPFSVTFQVETGAMPFAITLGLFAIRRGNEILAFTNTCTHMGCSVRWLDWREQILCPCHGGMYDRWGQLVGGPPAADLPFYLSKIQGNDLYVANLTVRRGVSGRT